MNKSTSVYLDAVRFAAACTVFLGHSTNAMYGGRGFLWQLDGSGTEAVDIFFVLSGFVIAYVYSRGESSPRVYAVSRLSRLYSVAFPALLILPVVDLVGQALRPGLYTQFPALDWHNPVHFLTGLTFTNELWNRHDVWGSNEPYWSLGFEAWYYVVFGLFVFVPGRLARWFAAGAGLLIAGPKIAVLFPLWLLGVACFKTSLRPPVGRLSGVVLFLGSLALLALFGWWPLKPEVWGQYQPLTLNPARLQSIIPDYAVGLLFAANLVGFHSLSDLLLPFLTLIRRPVRWLAGATLTMYLFHLPILRLVVALTPWAPSSTAARVTFLIAVPALVLVVAEFTERRKSFWRALFFRMLPPGIFGGCGEDLVEAADSR